jgi:DNA-binding response OmpR family regulator
MSERVSIGLYDAPILVVEDDEALRTLFIALLRRQGFAVECVNDGSQALDRLARNSYAVMLLDLMMPVKNGFDVLAELANKKSPLLRRTIITTGVSQHELAKVDGSTVFAVLRKPFDIDCLVSTVRDCALQPPARGRSSQREAESNDDEAGDPCIEAPARRLANALPELHQLLRSAPVSDGELLLRSELRRAVHHVAGALSDAAAVDRDASRAARLSRIAQSALTLVPTGGNSRVRDH